MYTVYITPVYTMYTVYITPVYTIHDVYSIHYTRWDITKGTRHATDSGVTTHHATESGVTTHHATESGVTYTNPDILTPAFTPIQGYRLRWLTDLFCRSSSQLLQLITSKFHAYKMSVSLFNQNQTSSDKLFPQICETEGCHTVLSSQPSW